jgi:hypothetical protein
MIPSQPFSAIWRRAPTPPSGWWPAPKRLWSRGYMIEMTKSDANADSHESTQREKAQTVSLRIRSHRIRLPRLRLLNSPGQTDESIALSLQTSNG